MQQLDDKTMLECVIDAGSHADNPAAGESDRRVSPRGGVGGDMKRHSL